MRPRSSISVTCHNHQCNYFGIEAEKNIIKRGKNHAGHQQYLCKHCGKIFLETANSFLYYKHFDVAELNELINLLIEKKSNRKISDLTGHHIDSIGDWLEEMALHPDEINKYLFFKLQVTRSEILNFWITVKKNKRKLRNVALTNVNNAIEALNSKELKFQDGIYHFSKENHIDI